MKIYTSGIPTITTDPENKQDLLYSINNLDAWCWILGFRVQLGEYFRNPFRPDDNPGCWLYENRHGLVLLADFASPEHNQMTFLHALKYIYPGESFYQQLKSFRIDYIAKHNIQIQQSYKTTLKYDDFKFYLNTHAREWADRDREVWSPYEITFDQMESEDVLPIDWYEKNSKYDPHRVEKHIPLDPAYRIRINGRDKVYRPLGPKSVKWISNLTPEDIGGKSKCSSNILWLTKSYKDYQVIINSNRDSRFTLNEGTPLTAEWIQSAVSEFDLIIPLMDNDPTGRAAAKQYEQQIINHGGKAYGAILPEHYYRAGITDPADLIKYKNQTQLNYELGKIQENAYSRLVA